MFPMGTQAQNMAKVGNFVIYLGKNGSQYYFAHYFVLPPLVMTVNFSLSQGGGEGGGEEEKVGVKEVYN